VAVVSARRQELAGEKVWVRGIIASHLGVPRSKIFFTSHHASHAATAFSDFAFPPGCDSDRRRRGRVGDADRRCGRAPRRWTGRDSATAGNPLSTFARNALLDVHCVSRLRRQ
jgi:hypothetical protein